MGEFNELNINFVNFDYYIYLYIYNKLNVWNK